MKPLLLFMAFAGSLFATQSLVQAVTNSTTATCGTSSLTSCAITAGNVTAGDALVAIFQVGATGTTITAVSSIPSVGTWVHGSCLGATTGINVDCWYIPSAGTSSALAPVITATSSVTNTFRRGTLYEFSPSAACTLVFDANGSGLKTSNTTNAGQALTLGGSNDVIVQGFYGTGSAATIASISGGYTIETGASIQATAYIINTASGAAPTWTFAGGSLSSVVNGIALQDSCGGGGGFVANQSVIIFQ